jgi:hypothetical protein
MGTELSFSPAPSFKLMRYISLEIELFADDGGKMPGT